MQNTCKKKVQVECRQEFDVNRLVPLCSAHSIPTEQLKHTKQKNNYSPNTRLTKHFLQIITLILAPDKFTNKFVSFSHQILCRYHLETKHYLNHLRKTDATSCISFVSPAENSLDIQSNISGS